MITENKTKDILETVLQLQSKLDPKDFDFIFGGLAGLHHWAKFASRFNYNLIRFYGTLTGLALDAFVAFVDLAAVTFWTLEQNGKIYDRVKNDPAGLAKLIEVVENHVRDDNTIYPRWLQADLESLKGRLINLPDSFELLETPWESDPAHQLFAFDVETNQGTQRVYIRGPRFDQCKSHVERLAKANQKAGPGLVLDDPIVTEVSLLGERPHKAQDGPQ